MNYTACDKIGSIGDYREETSGLSYLYFQKITEKRQVDDTRLDKPVTRQVDVTCFLSPTKLAYSSSTFLLCPISDEICDSID